jgi:hypothetical protein
MTEKESILEAQTRQIPMNNDDENFTMPEELPKENVNMPADIHNQINSASDNTDNLKDQCKEDLEKPNKTNETEKEENMEIYHHHGNHHKRKLKDYFFEFFMLFLAVTAGFFMENMRETYLENHKENQYLSSLVRELQEDTLTIPNIIQSNEIQIKGIDSLLVVLENPITNNDDKKKLFDLANHHLNKLQSFSVRDVTITQLRNTGGLRLIDTKSISDSIVVYYGNYDSHTEQQKYYYKILQEIMDMEMKIFDLSAYKVKGRKMSFDASYLKEFYNRIIVYQAMLKTEIDWLKNYQKQGISLLKFLKNGYGID